MTQCASVVIRAVGTFEILCNAPLQSGERTTVAYSAAHSINQNFVSFAVSVYAVVKNREAIPPLPHYVFTYLRQHVPETFRTADVKKLSRCLIKHYAMKAYGEGDVEIHFSDLGTSWR
jgi:hypothetical protein